MSATSIFVLLVLASSFVAWLLAAHARRKQSAQRDLAKRREGWGRPKSEARDLAPVARYHALTRGGAPSGIDDASWRDLGMDAVYAAIDRTTTFAGGARLYDRLRSPDVALDETRRFDEVVTVFAGDAGAREAVQTVLGSLPELGQPAIVDLLFGEIPKPSRLRRVFPPLGALTFVSLVGSFVLPPARVLLFLLALACIAVRVAHGRRGLGPIDAFRKVHGLLAIGGGLARLQSDALGREIGGARQAMGRLDGLRRATSWLLFEAFRESDLTAIFVTYVNAFFLLDLTALSFCLRLAEQHRRDLQALFALVGDLDAAVAVASFRAGLPQFSRPEIVPGDAALAIEGAVHPLVERAVPNAIQVGGRGALVTGANMAGKSTFVRTVAINALLAQTIYTTLTTRYRAPVLRVRTLMTANDDVERKTSYYLAELDGAKRLLAPSEPGTRTLVILDELFRGTGTSERVGAAKAILAALVDAGHFVIASTHDRELVGLLGGKFDPYHFGEEIVDGSLVFPYALRVGPATTRNAIALLQLAGFSAAVVSDALQVASAMDAR